MVFGQVISGQEVVQTMENQKTDPNSRPYAEVKILNCGELIPKSKGLLEPLGSLKKSVLDFFKLLLPFLLFFVFIGKKANKKREKASSSSSGSSSGSESSSESSSGSDESEKESKKRKKEKKLKKKEKKTEKKKYITYSHEF